MNQNTSLYGEASVWDQPLQEGQRNLLQAMQDLWPTGIDSVLDVGCGDGKLTSRLQAMGISRLTGLDSSGEALSRLSFPGVIGDARSLPFESQAFDMVISTDAFEHMEDAEEAASWQELFRVSDKAVMVAVPFREELLDATARCTDCDRHYHVNWHQRSYDLTDFQRHCPPGWRIAATVLSGQPWSAMLPPETRLRRHLLAQWAGWELSRCPYCSASGQVPPMVQPLPELFAEEMARQLYPALGQHRYCRSHSEVLVIFLRDHSGVSLPEPLLGQAWVQAASRVDLCRPPERPDLQPFCQVAQHVVGEDGQWRVQFPLYQSQPELEVRRVPGSSADLHLVLEDAHGVLLSGCVLHSDEQARVHRLPRAPVAGYYGVLASCPKHEPFASLQLGSAPSVLCLDRTAEQPVCYLPISSNAGPVLVQVSRPLWFDPQTLEGPVPEAVPSCTQVLQGLQERVEASEAAACIAGAQSLTADVIDADADIKAAQPTARVLMLCHDQHLDRRVLAQANSLIALGHSVHLLALSFDEQTHHEVIGEGFELTRIGLQHIIPENPTYKRYTARQAGLNEVLNRAAGRWPRAAGLFCNLFRQASRLNWSLYRLTLLARYHNTQLNDPLPFRQAFMLHGQALRSDLVQVHDLPALQAGAELAAAWGVPLVYDAHELYPEQKSFSRVQRRICSRAEAEHISKADLVFAVNQSIGDEMARRYRIAQPVTLLNAIDPHPEFDPQLRHDLLREKLGLSAERRILLFQGGFAPHRNLENLIQAMAHVTLADVDLVMLGFGVFGEQLKIRAGRLGLLGTRIHFLPAVAQSQLLQHSASADLGIIPYPHVDLNSYYCTPNKLFEFIQAGLPILANDSPELNRFVQANGFGHSARMSNARSIARAIDAAFTSADFPRWRESLKQKQRDLAWAAQDIIYVKEMSRLIETSKVAIESTEQVLP